MISARSESSPSAPAAPAATPATDVEKLPESRLILALVYRKAESFSYSID